MNPKLISAWIYLTALALGYVSAGWLLAAFQVSGLVWIGTLGMTLYLSSIGSDAIALSSAWIVGVVSVGAVIKAWTPAWNSHIPYENAQLWAAGLLGLWLWAMVLVVLLAFAQTRLRAIGIRSGRSAGVLAVAVWLALGCGRSMY